MPEYIERETALKIIDNYAKTVTDDGLVVVNAIKDIVSVICPTADVEPVKHGYIVIKPRVIGGFVNHKCPNPQCKHEWQTDERVKTLEVLCSECGKVLAHNYQNYCQYCGAKFDGRKCRNE